MAVDQFYAAATAADVLRSQKELARHGYSAGGRPPVGYKREPIVVGTRYDGTPLTRVRWVPDPEVAARVVQAFQMAAQGAMYDEIVAATGICANKSSLATIFANPIYRGIKVFNRETRVEGEHGRKRRRNPQQEVVTSEVEPIVPEQLWNRVQEMLTRRRANRLPVRRYAGGYVLTELLRCACGSRMAGTNSRERRYYRCLARCGRPQVRADHLEAGVMDRIRTALFTPDAIREMVTLLNEDIRLRAGHRGPDLDRARARVRKLEQQERVLYVSQNRAQQSAATPSPGAENAPPQQFTETVIIVFAGTDQDAELVKFAQRDQSEQGALTVTIRATADTANEDTKGLTIDRLVSDFGLPVPGIVEQVGPSTAPASR
jgi:hypothetical protein